MMLWRIDFSYFLVMESLKEVLEEFSLMLGGEERRWLL